ncbi:MAG: hydrogenase maturation nickel metallochaperone HypA [Anaerolineales bacterium]|jgi:Zn finger protein HypA/HybF involved in hydrogenase expression|nr:hydrogenase maturation nickel metallochaperone HypA [Anaerolineales bacterium]
MQTHPRLSSIVRQLIQQSAGIDSVQIAVGELLLDEPQLRAQWDALVSQTPLAKTKLNIRVVPAEQQCMVCFLIYHPNEKETACPQCKSVGAKIINGEELYLELD